MTRRQMLAQGACGIGGLALAALAADPAFAAPAQSSYSGGGSSSAGGSAFAPRPPQFRARATNVIFLYMDGGPSQVDTFDPKTLLDQENGRPFKMKMEPTQFNNNGNTLASPWKFRPGGTCGLPVSDLFPFVRACADELCVVRSMTSNSSEHTGANYFLHTGTIVQGRPTMGAWVSYGLGSECRNLPGFIVLNGGLIPVGGMDNFASGFLPATYQASIFKPGAEAVANVRPLEKRPELQLGKRRLLDQLDSAALARRGHDDQLESAVANYELAFRMQAAVPELMDLSGETDATKKLYGLDAPFEQTRIYGAQCLIARRLVERGVRFIELTCPRNGHDRWDQHGGLKKGHEDNARAVDQPIAGLLKDLRSRGLLDSTLVVFSGEFGRTPFAQGSDGRDHNPFGFSVWLAGGGVKGGTAYGATDEYGYKVVENKCMMHDLHATMLHLLGIDHKKLTYRWGGRDMRLTDVHGELIDGIIA